MLLLLYVSTTPDHPPPVTTGTRLHPDPALSGMQQSEG